MRITWITICLVFVLGSGLQLFSQPVINEFLALNTSYSQDPDYQDFSDWIELYNPGDTWLDISGYTLTDDLSDPGKWALPQGTGLDAGGYLVIWADGRNTGLHASFRLNGSGEQLGIFSKEGNPLDTLTFGSQEVDVSFGRDTSGSIFLFFSDPTPGLPNSGEGYAGISGEPEFSARGGFYNTSLELELTPEAQGTLVRFTVDGSEPDSTSQVFESPLSVATTLTLRAKMFEEGKLPGKTINHTYFISEPNHALPVISISTNPGNLWDDQEGIYENFMEEWEKPCGLEYFNPEGGQAININAGMRIFGGTSRSRPQKSLSIHTRNKYGDESISYPLLPGREIGEYKSFILRNSANDWSGDWRGTMFRDGLIHTLVEHQMDLDYQSYQPVVVYLNGAYWGIHNLRDKHNEDYCESLYGVDSDSVTIIKHNEVVSGDDLLYRELMEFLEQHDLDQEENYQVAASMIDIDEFINYMIAEIYSCNIDWPANNHRLWRPATPGGKWRWMLFDTEFGFNGFQWAAPTTNMFNKALDPDIDDYVNKGEKAPWATIAFIKLTQNEGFVKRFVSTYLSHMYTTYDPERVAEIVDHLAGNLEGEMPRHISRWGNEGGIYSMDVWRDHVQGMKDFAWERPFPAKQHLMETFGIGSADKVNLEIVSGSGGEVTLNGIPLDQGPFNNEFSLGLPVSLRMQPGPGFAFKGWMIEDSSRQEFRYVETGASWKYLDDGGSPGEGWMDADFDDVSWKSGSSKFGFGDGNQETLVSFGSDTENKYVAYYFRTAFFIEEADAVINLDMNLLRDDGAVVYLNGTEIRRSNMTSREVTWETLALSEVTGADEDLYHTYAIDPGLLVEGRNVMAVEIHQASKNSTDMGFDLQVTGTGIGASEPVLVNSVALEWILKGDVRITALLEPSGEIPDLRINEIVAGNDTGIQDAYGDRDDWIEIYNRGSESVNLEGLFITDSLPLPLLWEIPSGNPLATTIEPGGFIILWADDEPEEGEDHVGFKLSKSGEQVGLFMVLDEKTILLDSVTYTSVPDDLSMARYPDGDGSWRLFDTPTPSSYNFFLGKETLDEPFNGLTLYPNPSTGWIMVRGWKDEPETAGGQARVSVINESGRVVHQQAYPAGEHFEMDLSACDPGLYLVRILVGKQCITRKVVLLQ